MAQNEAPTTEGSGTFRLTSIKDVEEVIRTYAIPIAKKWRIREDMYNITLHTKLKRGDMEIIGGPVVQICLLYPAVLGTINAKLESAFSLIKRRPKIITPLSVERYALVAGRKAAMRKFAKEKFSDMAEVLPDLLGPHRIHYTTMTTVIAKDIVTGEQVEVNTINDGFRLEWEGRIIARHKLSRLVREKHDVDDEDDADASETETMQRCLTNTLPVVSENGIN